jgi:hypothetical protein
MKTRVWYKWPEGYFDDNIRGAALPWYTVLRRVIFVVPLLMSAVLYYGFACLGWGKEEADRMMNNGW